MLLYIGERDTSVTVDLHLPAQVTMVVIHEYGETEPFCFCYCRRSTKMFSFSRQRALQESPRKEI